jgi:hypothetical protein
MVGLAGILGGGVTKVAISRQTTGVFSLYLTILDSPRIVR